MDIGAVVGCLGRDDSSGMMTAYRQHSLREQNEGARKTNVITVEPSPGRQWQEEWRPGDPRGGVAIHSVGLLCLEKERGPASLSLVRSAEQSRQLSAQFHSQPLRPGVLQNRLHLPPVSWGGTSRACTDTSGLQTGACTDTTGPAAGGTFGYHRAGTRHGHSRKVLGSPVPGKGYSSTSHPGGKVGKPTNCGGEGENLGTHSSHPF